MVSGAQAEARQQRAAHVRRQRRHAQTSGRPEHKTSLLELSILNLICLVTAKLTKYRTMIMKAEEHIVQVCIYVL